MERFDLFARICSVFAGRMLVGEFVARSSHSMNSLCIYQCSSSSEMEFFTSFRKVNSGGSMCVVMAVWNS